LRLAIVGLLGIEDDGRLARLRGDGKYAVYGSLTKRCGAQ
jgi:hypothetical protein